MAYKINKKLLKTLNHRRLNPDLVDMFGHTIHDEYYQGAEAAEQYVYDVLTDKIKVNIHTKNTCKRFLHDLERDDLRVDYEEIELVLAFANSLCHPKGPLSGQPVFLLPWIIFLLYNIYGFYYTEGLVKGERRFQKAFVMVARGNAKSFIASIIGLYGMIVTENGSPLTITAARTRDQASIVLKDAKKMVNKASSSIKKMFNVRAHDILASSTDGLFIAGSSDSQSLDGKRVNVGILDELHTHPTSEVYNVIRTGTASNKDPIMLSITTAGKDLDSFCFSLMHYLRDIVANRMEDDRYFSVEYAIDDNDDYTDQEVWIKANPSLGHSVILNSLVSTLKESSMNITQRNDFLTKHCNRFVAGAENGYLDLLELQECATELDIEDYIGKPCYLGLDLAQRTDLCSLAYIFPNDKGGVDIFTTNYLPVGVLKRVKPAVAEKYRNWEEEGSLVLTNGESTDWRVIKEDIIEANKDFQVLGVAYDPANATELVNNLEDENVLMVSVSQGYGLSEAAKSFDALVKDRKVKYDETDKVFEWCASNAVMTEGQFQDIKIHKAKEKPDSKVDSIIAVITGMKLVTLKTDNTSVYEYKEILQL